jgi:hypothetical protein
MLIKRKVPTRDLRCGERVLRSGAPDLDHDRAGRYHTVMIRTKSVGSNVQLTLTVARVTLTATDTGSFTPPILAAGRIVDNGCSAIYDYGNYVVAHNP